LEFACKVVPLLPFVTVTSIESELVLTLFEVCIILSLDLKWPVNVEMCPLAIVPMTSISHSVVHGREVSVCGLLLASSCAIGKAVVGRGRVNFVI
jgi:hypothetical protein